MPTDPLLLIGHLKFLAAAKEFAHLKSQSVLLSEVTSVTTLCIRHMDQQLLAAQKEVDQVLLLVLHELDDERVALLVPMVNISAILIDEP